MIRAVYRRESLTLTVKGHAGSDAWGRDLVCAGVSALVLTLSASIGRLREAGQISEAVVILESGSARIHCRPRPDCRARVEEIFETVCTGLRMLARKFPGYVSYREE